MKKRSYHYCHVCGATEGLVTHPWIDSDVGGSECVFGKGFCSPTCSYELILERRDFIKWIKSYKTQTDVYRSGIQGYCRIEMILQEILSEKWGTPLKERVLKIINSKPIKVKNET